MGLGGYSRPLGVSAEEAQEKFAERQYIVRITATFSPYFVGHPEMAAHREWAQYIVEGLAQAFSEETLWKRTTDAIVLQ